MEKAIKISVYTIVVTKTKFARMNNFMDSSDDSIASYKSNSSSSIDYHSSLSISFDDNVPDYEQMHEVLEIAGMHTNNGKVILKNHSTCVISYIV